MKCDVKECFELATVRAYSKGETVDSGYTGYYCEKHAVEVVRKSPGGPEYVAQCPCCSCLFGVN